MAPGRPRSVRDGDMDTLTNARHVRPDDLLKESLQLAPCRPAGRHRPGAERRELVIKTGMQSLRDLARETR
jgi:hypothetical protein